MASRTEFDYLTYSEELEENALDGFADQQSMEDYMYRRAVGEAVKLERKANNYGDSQVDRRKAVQKVEEYLPDARWALGVSSENSEEDQLSLLQKPAFAKYVRSSGLAKDTDDVDVHISGYLKHVRGDAWANPLLSRPGTEKLIRQRLEENLKDTSTVQQLYDATDPEKIVAAETAKAAAALEPAPEKRSVWQRFKAATPAGMVDSIIDHVEKGTFDGVGDAWTRSSSADDAGSAAADLFSAPPTPEVGTRNRTDFAPQAPQDEPARLLEAATRMAAALDEQDKTPISPKLLAVSKLKTWDDMVTYLTNSPSTLALMAAESGVDMAQELAATAAGGAGGALVGGPAGAAAGMTVASGAAAAGNSYNAYLLGEVTAELAKRKLDRTPQNIAGLMGDEEFVNRASTEATTTAAITGVGTGASTLVGGALTGAVLGKFLAKVGIKPVADTTGRIVLSQYQPGAAVGAVVAGTAATGIDVATEATAAAATGKEFTGADVAASVALNAAMSVPDVAIGAATGARNEAPIGANLNEGQVLFDKDGNEASVLDVTDEGVRLQVGEDDTPVTVPTAEIIAGYSTERPAVIPRATDDEVAATVNAPIPVTLDPVGYQLVKSHVDRMATLGKVKFPPEFSDNMDAELNGGLVDLTERLAGVIDSQADSNTLMIETFLSSGAIVEDGSGIYRAADKTNETQNLMAVIAGTAKDRVESAKQVETPDVETEPEGVTSDVLATEQVIQAIAGSSKGTVTAKQIQDAYPDVDAEVELQLLTDAGYLGEPVRGRREVKPFIRNLVGREDLRQAGEPVPQVEGDVGTKPTPPVEVDTAVTDFVTNKPAAKKSGVRSIVPSDLTKETGPESVTTKEQAVEQLQALQAQGVLGEPVSGRYPILDAPVQPNIDPNAAAPAPAAKVPEIPKNLRSTYKAVTDKVLSRDEKLAQKDSELLPHAIANLNDAQLTSLAGRVYVRTESSALRKLTPSKVADLLRNVRQVHQQAQSKMSITDIDMPDFNQLRKDARADTGDMSSADIRTELGAAGASKQGDVATLKKKIVQLRFAKALPDDSGVREIQQARFNALKSAGVKTVKGTFKFAPPVELDRKSLGLNPRRATQGGLAPAPTTRMQIEPVVREATTVELSSRTNFIQGEDLDALRNDGFEITPVGRTPNGDITSFMVAKDDQSYYVQSTGDEDPKANKDRKYTVHTGSRFTEDGKVVKGTKWRSFNGRFEIPSSIIHVRSKDDVDAVAKLINQSEGGKATSTTEMVGDVPTTTLTREGENSVKFEFKPDGVYVDGVLQDGPIGVRLRAVKSEHVESIEASASNMQFLANLRTSTPQLSPRERMALEHAEAIRYIDEEPALRTVPGTDRVAIESDNPMVTVEIDSPDGQHDLVLRAAKIDTIQANIATTMGDTDADIHVHDVATYEDMIATLPPHIQQAFVFHTDKNNEAAAIGAIGFFTPDYHANGPQIHIDISPGRHSRKDILDTIAEEVSHFSWNSWTTGSTGKVMKSFYDKAFDLYRGDIVNSLPEYIHTYKVDMDNATDAQKQMLLNEEFSKHGMSFMGFTDDRIPVPGGIPKADIQALREKARDGANAFITDMNTGGTTDRTKFAEEILIRQARAIHPRSSMFEYRDGDTILRITPTPFGRSEQYLVREHTTEGTTHKADILQARRTDELEAGVADWLPEERMKLKRWFRRNSLVEHGHLGRDIQRVLTDAGAIDAVRTHKQLQQHLTVSRRVQAIIGPDAKYMGTYSETMRVAGITNRDHLQLAKIADDQVYDMRHSTIVESEKLRNEGMKQIDLLRYWGETTGVDADELGVMMSLVEQNMMRYKADGYEHRRYKAFEDPEQVKDFRKMILFLDGNQKHNIYQDKIDADKRIATLEADTTMTDAAREKAINKQRKKAAPYNRLVLLNEALQFKAGKGKTKINPDGNILPDAERDSRKVKEMRDALVHLTEQANTHTQRASRLTTIDRNSKLDRDAGRDTYDGRMIEFLQPVTDPLEVAVYTKAHQQDVLRQLQDDRRLSVAILEAGLGNIGTPKKALTTSRNGSMLEFIDTPEDIFKEIQAQRDATQSVDRHWLMEYIGVVKMNATVLGPVTLTNWLGVPSMLMLHGHVRQMGKIAAMTPAIRKAWLNRTQERLDDPSWGQKMINELTDGKALGTGVNAAELDILNSNEVYQKTGRILSKMVKEIGLVEEEGAIALESRIKTIVDGAKDFYTMTDDAPKILSYWINRDLVESKYRAITKREGYPDNASYENAIEEATVREAVDRTRREQTDWAVTPEFLQRLASGGFSRIFTPDFFLHGFQMGKVIAEWGRLTKEDKADYDWAVANGHTEMAAAYRGVLAAKVAGAVPGVVGLASVTIGKSFPLLAGASLMAVLTNQMLSMVMDDEDTYSAEQLEGAAMFTRTRPYAEGAYHEPLAFKMADNKFLAVNYLRMSPSGFLSQTPMPGDEGDYHKQVARIIEQNILTQDSNIIFKTASAVSGLDWKGDKVGGFTDSGYWANLAETLGKPLVPGFARVATEIVTETNFLSDKHKDRTVSLLKMGGINAVIVDPMEEIQRGAWATSRDLTKRSHVVEFLNNMKYGTYAITDEEALAWIRTGRERDVKLLAMARNGVIAAKKMGLSESQIIEGLTKKHLGGKGRGPLSAKVAKQLYRGEDIFWADTKKKVTNALKDRQLKRTDKHTYPQHRKDTAIKNLELLQAKLQQIN